MNIVFTHQNDNPILHGLAAAITVVEPNTLTWAMEQKPAFDMFDEVKPDVLFCTTQDVVFNPSIIEALKEFQNTKLVLYGVGATNIIPDLICLPPDIPKTIVENIKAKSLQTRFSANHAQFCRGKYDERHKSDILYVSNEDLTNQIDRLNILDKISSLGHSFKIVGQYSIDLPNYLGSITISEATSFIASSKIVLDFNEQIMWDCAINKVFCMSNIDNPIYHKYTDETIIEDITHFLGEEKLRKSVSKRAYKIGLGNTYYEQAKNIFNIINFSSLSSKLETKLNECE